MLIVLSGEAGAGKDSLADVLVKDHGFVKFSLSAPLKRFVEDMFGFTKDQLYGPSRMRNTVDKRWALKCLTCNGTGKVYGTDIEHAPCEGTGRVYPISPRSVLQLLGSEYLRDLIHPDCLSFRASWDLGDMMERNLNIVVNDARYQNDRNNLHEWLGAHRVDVRTSSGSKTKRKKTKHAWRGHSSETDRPSDDQLEYVVDNVEEWPFPGLAVKVKEMLTYLDAQTERTHPV